MFCAGAPCREREKAFILAAMSEVSPLALVGGGPGRRAAFIWPSGAEDGVKVLEKDPTFAVRSEGGLGGEVEPSDGCSVEGDLEASSEGCDSAFACGSLLWEPSSISAIAQRFKNILVEYWGLKSRTRRYATS